MDKTKGRFTQMKTIITILVELTHEQEQKIVHFIDNFVTTQFIVHQEDYKTVSK